MKFKVILFLACIFSLFIKNHAAKILCISAVTSKSMKTYMQSVAESLAKKGHQVIFLIQTIYLKKYLGDHILNLIL